MSSVVRGVNYEGGKIEQHAQRLACCIGSVNAQIAMDAPFHGAVADEALRACGRAEVQFAGYDRERMHAQLRRAIDALLRHCEAEGARLLIVQLARGRSAVSMLEEIRHLLPPQEVASAEAGAAESNAGGADSTSGPSGGVQMRVRFGYRSSDFFRDEPDRPFAFLNVGMFARLDGEGAAPGEVFVPSHTWDVAVAEDQEAGQGWRSDCTLCVVARREHGGNAKSVPVPGLRSCHLLGIADNMPFVTPQHYSLPQLTRLFGQ